MLILVFLILLLSFNLSVVFLRVFFFFLGGGGSNKEHIKLGTINHHINIYIGIYILLTKIIIFLVQ